MDRCDGSRARGAWERLDACLKRSLRRFSSSRSLGAPRCVFEEIATAVLGLAEDRCGGSRARGAWERLDAYLKRSLRRFSSSRSLGASTCVFEEIVVAERVQCLLANRSVRASLCPVELRLSVCPYSTSGRRSQPTADSVSKMKIAVEGCMHGDLDNVYATLLHLQEVERIKIDLLICCGDFQAVRNETDLESLAVPPMYRTMNSFWKYYSGEKAAPFPTIFIGGNHEASNYLWELYYGGWVAPQIFFLGFAGVVRFGNVRIGGLSGIYNSHHYYSGHHEKLPYTDQDIRSIYQVREYDVKKLMQVQEPIDIFLSHDWPRGITDYGNSQNLLRRKHFFEQEIEKGTLGNPAARDLMAKLRPSYWFSAHLHCKFSALVQHGENGPTTKFLALDKCLPGRRFLQVIEIESETGPHSLQYDEEWLAITKKFNPIFPRTEARPNFSDAKLNMEECRLFVKNKLQMRGRKPFEFVRTAPCHKSSRSAADNFPSGHCRNPQTEALLELLGLQYCLD
ncbi:Lariat debranching enzyme [Striga hermonthica]|uniref:Lariat debranching enzyme n=1 Tax=Striga hermonthica TaxID=68872 RepID=A0A9N7NCP7_STRHE|nr:Lariat debranching enzyme [Striga hermonthica]